jgi:hypothetical protein
VNAFTVCCIGCELKRGSGVRACVVDAKVKMLKRGVGTADLSPLYTLPQGYFFFSVEWAVLLYY